MANLENFNFNKLSPFKWFVLNNFPFIDADFDAMTEWQLFQKIGEWINKIIDSQNTVGAEFEKVIDAYIELYNYVDNFFKTLDIQDEINNKLNDMAEDGTLQNLLNNYANITRVYSTTVKMIEDHENIYENQKIKTLGYYDIDDDGGAEFIVTDTYDNTKLQIELSNGLFATIISKDLCPEMMGAKGDGESNDYQSFQKILNVKNTLLLNEKSYFLGDSIIDIKNKSSIEIVGKNRNSTLIGGTFLVNLNNTWTSDKDGNTATQPAYPLHIDGVRWNKNHTTKPAIVCACPVLIENCLIFYYQKFLALPNTCYVDRVNFLECNFYLDSSDYGTGTLIIGCDGVDNYSDWIGNGDDWIFKNCSMTPIYEQVPLLHVSHGNHSITFENCINPCVCFGSDSNYKDLPQIYFNECHFENTYNACYPKTGSNNQKALVNYNNCYFHSYSEFNYNDIFTGLNYYTSKPYYFRPDNNTNVGLQPTRLDKFNGVIVPFASAYKHKKDYTTRYKIPNTKSIGISSQERPERIRVTPISATMDYVFYYSDNAFSYDKSTKILKENTSPNINNFNLWYVDVSENTNFFLHIFRKNNSNGHVQRCVMYVGSSWAFESPNYLFQDGGNSVEGIYKWEDYDDEFPR